MSVTAQQVSESLLRLAETDAEHARKKARMEGLEYLFKTVKATEYLGASGTNGEREQKANASKAYQDHAAKYEQAVLDFTALDNERKTLILTIDVWRSLNANQRKGNI